MDIFQLQCRTHEENMKKFINISVLFKYPKVKSWSLRLLCVTVGQFRMHRHIYQASASGSDPPFYLGTKLCLRMKSLSIIFEGLQIASNLAHLLHLQRMLSVDICPISRYIYSSTLCSVIEE